MIFIDELERLVGPPVAVTEEIIKACQVKGQFGALVYELYKEAGMLTGVSSSVYFGDPGEAIKFERDQAICAGLLVRISKLMLSVVKLSSGVEHGETVQALNRCIIESAVDLQFLLLKDDSKIYDRFVTGSLVAELELDDMIRENVEARCGKELLIEKGLLRSIESTIEQSGVTLDEINRKAGGWGGSLRDKLTALGYGWEAYTILVRIPSHAVHGDWVDLIKNHLSSTSDGFAPNPNHLITDGELIGPMGVFVIEANLAYLDKYIGNSDVNPLYLRLASLKERLSRVEEGRGDLTPIK